jgi:hypothetical protein
MIIKVESNEHSIEFVQAGFNYLPDAASEPFLARGVLP